jgi:GTP-binding protein LepA
MKDNIRNFSIIAHIDHGKTTLTDRLLEVTKTVEPRLMHERFLDSHPIAQERGVTIKLAPVRMDYSYHGKDYVLNLIDTPGHIDFTYEVSRSLASCEGAVLLVDAAQGIQAQTLANYRLAKKLDLKIIPIVNKIDLSNAQIEKTAGDLVSNLGFTKEEILFISAKTGENVVQVCEKVIENIPAPKGDEDKSLKALVFDSFYHTYKGVVVYLRVFNGEVDLKKKDQSLRFVGSGGVFQPLEIGYLAPEPKPKLSLKTGEVGYLATGLKDVSLCQVGDTITLNEAKNITLLPGYKEPKPVVFFDFYPVENKDFALLSEALDQLKLNDFALNYNTTGSPALGKGFRVGFLGVFHGLITQERLERDFNLDIVITSPSVEYQIVLQNNSEKNIQNASQVPDLSEVKEIREPWVKISIFTPVSYLGNIFELCQQKRAQLQNQTFYGDYINLEFLMPLVELIEGFYDELKSVSSGFASLDYEMTGFKAFNAAKLEVFINKQNIEALTMIVAKEKGEIKARKLAKKFKEVIPSQQFEVPIQIALNSRIIARETVKALRKDVTAKLYGGDQTRKDKLLKKQKKGKKRLKQIGKVTIPQEAFMAVLEVK